MTKPFGIYKRSEFPHAFLSIDEDGELAKLASPRSSQLPDIKSRIETLIKAFQEPPFEKGGQGGFQGIALTVEELCPGSLDPTDGILIAQAFEKAGAQFIIASSGTKDFPALKYRRSTQTQKSPNYPWLASACWLIGRVKIPVYAQGDFKLPAEHSLIKEAKACGLSGLVSTKTLCQTTK